jgi:hypothetical protein
MKRRRPQAFCRIAALLVLTLVSVSGQGAAGAAKPENDRRGETEAAKENSAAEKREESVAETSTGEDESWVDVRYKDLNRRADVFANWVDDFFGHARSVQDSPASIVRIRPQFEWDEQEDTDWKIRATGRLHLPRTSDRLSLVFLGQREDFEDEFYDPAGTTDGDSTLGLEYQIRDEERHWVYLFAGMKAGPKGKLGVRYRYQAPFLKRNRFRFSEEFYWVGGDGFGTLTRADIDRTLSSSTLLRWANKAEYSEESNGVEWNSRVAWVKRLDEDAAFRAFTFIRGETDPEILNSRGFGVAYRRKFLRDWLFWELEPRYAWRKRRQDRDRDGVAMVTLRFEVIIDGRQSAQR